MTEAGYRVHISFHSSHVPKFHTRVRYTLCGVALPATQVKAFCIPLYSITFESNYLPIFRGETQRNEGQKRFEFSPECGSMSPFAKAAQGIIGRTTRRRDA